MARRDSLEDDVEVDEVYHESSDEDFNPNTAPADDSPSSSDEEPAAKTTPGRRKRKAPASDELDSGDEVTIEAARKRRPKKRKGAKEDDEDLLLSDDGGGDGGLIKTRAQRRVEQKERKPLARTDGATVDVDALWAQVIAAPLKPLYYDTAPRDVGNDGKVEGADAAITSADLPIDDETDLISIKKIYVFAGQRTVEEKQIPRSSLEQHLSDGWKESDAASTDPVEPVAGEKKEVEGEALKTGPKIRRPVRRPSRYDPNPTGYVRALPPEHQLSWPRKSAIATTLGQKGILGPATSKAPRVEKAQKLNVVDKSRLDWTGFVNKEGIADELDVHGRTKEAYLGRMDFLAGVEARREEDRKKMKAAVVS